MKNGEALWALREQRLMLSILPILYTLDGQLQLVFRVGQDRGMGGSRRNDGASRFYLTTYLLRTSRKFLASKETIQLVSNGIASKAVQSTHLHITSHELITQIFGERLPFTFTWRAPHTA